MDLKQTIAELREMADALERLDLPDDSQAWNHGASVTLWSCSKEDLRIFARSMGEVRKHASEHSFNLSKWFGNSTISAYAKSREAVCRKVIVEVVKEPKRAYVDIPGEFVDKEVVEWECDPILGV